MDRLGAPTVEANANILLHLRRQELGMCVLRANAHLLLARVRQAFSARLTLRAPEQAPIGARPEGGESAFACLADGAYHNGGGTPSRGTSSVGNGQPATSAPARGDACAITPDVQRRSQSSP